VIDVKTHVNMNEVQKLQRHRRQALFDGWAADYDRAVASSSGEFPFDGYEDVLSTVVALADVTPGITVLPKVGTGTGNLAARLVGQGCVVWGLDFSEAMIEAARAKAPDVHLVRADLRGQWPAELPARFDRIVSAYVLHEFDLATKVTLLGRLARQHLSVGGRIVIGDIAFPDRLAREAASRRWASLWDGDEHYWAADEALGPFEAAGLAMDYRQVSSCGGVFTVWVPAAAQAA
jgi:putative AdoMet-dependent methyltransferase